MPDLSQTIAAPRRALLWRAAMYMVVASFLFATMNALAKYVLITPAGAEIGALQVTFCRYLSGTLFLLPALFLGQGGAADASSGKVCPAGRFRCLERRIDVSGLSGHPLGECDRHWI